MVLPNQLFTLDAVRRTLIAQAELFSFRAAEDEWAFAVQLIDCR
jgi:hypothetical protein